LDLTPFWALFGYVVYRDLNKEILITNISRESLKNKKSVYGYYLSNDIFVAHRKNNSENNSDLNIMQ